MSLAPKILCISISSSPGRFGTLVHNTGYHALGLDYLYNSFKISDLRGAVQGVRSLGIRGCSVSMPFKEEVLPYLDSLSGLALEVGAVNTIVNTEGHLKGYNTDVSGVVETLRPYVSDLEEPVLLLGAGGVARAIYQALHLLGLKKLTIATRSPNKVKGFKGASIVAWEKRNQVRASILIHATPIGMATTKDQLPIDSQKISSFRLVMDLVVSPQDTPLIRESKKQALLTIDGVEIALHQAYEQFFLYTRHTAPREAMAKAARTLYG